jgi:hypothetical protein
MAQLVSPTINKEGLCFYFDQYNQKSYIGQPVRNLAWGTNPRLDSTYALRNSNPGGTYAQFHADAIRVYNTAGTEITNYDNTGVTDWTNTRHAKWVYDGELGEPVVVMQNITDGSSWKAKTFGMSPNSDWTLLAPNVGDVYTISWLQWVDNISLSANCGLYYNNTAGGGFSFHDGLSNSQSTSYNTRARTWQRVYATFTRGPNSGTTTSGWYCYGMNTGAGIIKMADVQVNAGINTKYTGAENPASTTVIRDITRNATITPYNLTYRQNNFDFTAASAYLDMGNPASLTTIGGTSAITVACWTNFFSHASPSGQPYAVVTNSGNPWIWLMENPGNRMIFRITAGGADVNAADPNTFNINTWYYWVGTYDGATIRMYRNGVQVAATAQTGVLGTGGGAGAFRIGQYVSNTYTMNGRVGSCAIYNRALTADEILRNYQATKGVYGL